MEDIMRKIFDELDSSLSAIEARFLDNNGAPDLPTAPMKRKEQAHLPNDIGPSGENDQTDDVSGQIARLNDRFRQNQPTADSDIKGQWILGEDIEDLPGPTKSATKKKGPGLLGL